MAESNVALSVAKRCCLSLHSVPVEVKFEDLQSQGSSCLPILLLFQFVSSKLCGMGTKMVGGRELCPQVSEFSHEMMLQLVLVLVSLSVCGENQSPFRLAEIPKNMTWDLLEP